MGLDAAAIAGMFDAASLDRHYADVRSALAALVGSGADAATVEGVVAKLLDPGGHELKDWARGRDWAAGALARSRGGEVLQAIAVHRSDDFAAESATHWLAIGPAWRALTDASASLTAAMPKDRVSVLDHIPADEHRAIQAGTTTFDASAAVSAAFAAGDAVHFPPGRYQVRDLVFRGRVLDGEGATLAWLPGGGGHLLTIAADDARVDGLAFEGNAEQAVRTAAVQLEGARQRLSRCEFRGFRGKCLSAPGRGVLIAACTFRQTGTDPNANAIDLRGPEGIVAACGFDDIGDGHCVRIGVFRRDRAGDCRGFVIAGNQVRRTRHGAFTSELGANRGFVLGNHVDAADAAYKTESGDSVHDITIAFNTVTNLTDAGPVDLNSPGVVYVGNRHAGLPNGGPFLGDGGRCDGNVFVRCSGMSTWAEGQRATFVGNTILDPDIPAAGQVITLRGGSVAQANRIVASGGRHAGIGIRVFGADNIVVDNHVEGLAQGIALATTCTRSKVVGNAVLDCPAQAAVVRGRGDNEVSDNLGFGGPGDRGAGPQLAGGDRRAKGAA